jgi:Domain of unknown function (DU1801)
VIVPKTAAPTVSAYLAALPPDRRTTFQRVRRLIKAHLPPGYKETVSRNTLAYVVPLSAYPTTYNGHPLWYVALSAEKNYASLHLMAAYGSAELTRRLEEGFRKAGKRLDMGKACIRFRAFDDLAADTVGDVIGAVPMAAFIAHAEAARTRKRPAARTP